MFQKEASPVQQHVNVGFAVKFGVEDFLQLLEIV